MPKKTKNNYSQLDKEEQLLDDFSMLEPGKSDIRNFKEQTHNQKELKEIIANKYVSNGERSSLPPKATKPRINDFDSKTVTMKQPNDKGISKDLSPAKTVSLISKPSSSIQQPAPPLQHPASSIHSAASFTEELKFVRPTREISFQHVSKFQELMVETERQADSHTL